MAWFGGIMIVVRLLLIIFGGDFTEADVDADVDADIDVDHDFDHDTDSDADHPSGARIFSLLGISAFFFM